MNFKEYLGEILKINEKEDYVDQINRKIRQARKEKNAEKYVYYTQALDKSAVVGFEDDGSDRTWFKNSAVYPEWKNKNKEEIEKINKEFKRFAYMENFEEERSISSSEVIGRIIKDVDDINLASIKTYNVILKDELETIITGKIATVIHDINNVSIASNTIAVYIEELKDKISKIQPTIER